MATAAFESSIKRNAPLLLALAALTILAWLDLVAMAGDMSLEPGHAPAAWTAGYFAAMAAMWAIMMAAMMVPSAAPTILLFSALRRASGTHAARDTALFVAGYLIAWSAFSVVATAAQWALSATALLSGAMASEGPDLAGVLFIAAGVYQFSAFKDACLAHCRSPVQFLVERRREGALAPLAMGLEHGMHCVGCCAALMALLFAFGVMNLLWVLALSAFVLVEKLMSGGALFGRVSGVAMVALGAMFLNT